MDTLAYAENKIYRGKKNMTQLAEVMQLERLLEFIISIVESEALQLPP